MTDKILAILTLAFLAGGCDSNELTRSRAEDLIRDSDAFVNKWRSANDDKGVQEGLWVKKPKQVGRVGGYELTEKGKEDWQPQKRFRWFAPKNINSMIAIEITGIADIPLAGESSGIKEVQFTWHFENLGEFEQYADLEEARKKRDSKAFMRLYDDGWRLEEIEL